MIALSGSTFDTMKFASRIVAQQHTDWNMESAAVRLVDDLIAQVDDPARPPESFRIRPSLCLYENGKAVT